MPEFPLHRLETAPEAARPTLESIREELGFIPNLFAEMADAPATLDAYLGLDEAFDATSLGARERTIVRLAVSRANRCHYCVAVHSTELAESGFPREELEALRRGEPLSDERLEALRSFADALTRQRGQVSDERVDAFLDAGFERKQALEVVLGVSLKTLSNTINHLADTPVDEAFADWAWSGEATASEAAAV